MCVVGMLAWILTGVCVCVGRCFLGQSQVCVWVGEARLDTHGCVCGGDACVLAWTWRGGRRKGPGEVNLGSRSRGSGKERAKVGEESGATPAGVQDGFHAGGRPPCPCPHH